MSGSGRIYQNGRIFDGSVLRDGYAICVDDGTLTFLGPQGDAPTGSTEVDLGGDILCPGYVDLQVNGGGGIMFNDDPSLAALERIAKAHRSLGVRALLPTLITDTAEKTSAAIAAVEQAVRAGIDGIVGLHLEGPHLSIARKGAHDPVLIRSMTADDLDILLAAAKSLPVLKITVAPENVTEDQVTALVAAGALVSLGHTDADFETCRRYFAAGAQCATHLFNAMSQLGNREPGLVGAALADGSAWAGLIADSVHVHPESMRIAWAAKKGPGRIFLVSDAMAVAGTSLASFELGGRKITRQNGILTLSNGTLAGADLDLTTAIRVMVDNVGVALEEALRAATSSPADLIGYNDAVLSPGKTKVSQILRISKDLHKVWNLA